MEKHYPRIILVLVTIVLSALIIYFGKFRLGPDLTGGTILVYRVKDAFNADLEQLTPTLKERLDSSGLKNYVIRPLGNDRVEIVMPKAELADIQEVKLKISTVGQLEFMIVADQRKHKQLMEDADYAWNSGEFTFAGGQFVPYGLWTPMRRNGSDTEKSLIQKGESATQLKVDENVRFRPIESITKVDVSETDHLVKQFAGRRYVLARWGNDDLEFDQFNLTKVSEDGEHYVLMVDDPPELKVTGEFLTRAYPTLDEQNRPAIGFAFDNEGAARFRRLTTENQPQGDLLYKLGIVLDGRLRSAPVIQAVISSSGIIQGNFDNAELQALEQIFKSGRLPYTLEKEPVQERTIGPSLGADTIRSGQLAIIGSFALVVVFTLIYYQVAGIIAVIALFLNLLYTIALMVLFQATWTLPGLAGLVLTVGMAVDSNVLIFERMREELDLGRPLGLAIRAGYEKAWGTIFDSNLTTILTAVILFLIGTDQVKGFAVTLILGLLTSMFSAVFVTRIFFDVLYDTRWLRRLTMFRFLSNPNVDFLSAARVCTVLSLLLIAAGAAAVVSRGWGILDIDFTGGTAAGLQFKEPITIAQVRGIASDIVADPSIEEIQVEGEPSQTRYLIRTVDRDEEGTPKEDSIRSRLAGAFEGKLVTTGVTVGPAESLSEPQLEDDRIKPFADGKIMRLTFSPPQSEDAARRQLVRALSEAVEEGADPVTQFALLPVREGASTMEGTDQYTAFDLVTKLDVERVSAVVTKTLSGTPLLDPYDQFGAQVATETQGRAIWAIILSWVGIIVYVSFRFKSWTFGVASVAALVHDVLVATGLLAIFSILAVRVPAIQSLLITEMKINLDVVAALMTLIGYSVNDTIVIFDRIREIKGKGTRVTREMVHRALNSTLSRTIITALLTFLAVIVLYIVGGESLRGFAFVLVVGIISGTYSTVFIACPLVLMLERWRERGTAKKSPPVTTEPAAAGVNF